MKESYSTVWVKGYLAHKNRPTLGFDSRPMPRAVWWSWGGWRFLASEVPLYATQHHERRALSQSLASSCHAGREVHIHNLGVEKGLVSTKLSVRRETELEKVTLAVDFR